MVAGTLHETMLTERRHPFKLQLCSLLCRQFFERIVCWRMSPPLRDQALCQCLEVNAAALKLVGGLLVMWA